MLQKLRMIHLHIAKPYLLLHIIQIKMFDFPPHHSNRLSTKILRIALHAKPRKAQHLKGRNQ